MELSSSSSGVVESSAGQPEVTEELVVPQRNRPWKYIPQFSDEDCRLLRVEDRKEEDGRRENQEGESTDDGGLLQYYRHNRALETTPDNSPTRDFDEDLNGDLEIEQLAQVVYGRAPPPPLGGQTSTADQEIYEDVIVPVRIERRSQMDAPFPEEEEDHRPRGNGLTSGGPWGNKEVQEEALVEDVEQLQWRSYSSSSAVPFSHKEHLSSAEEHPPPSQFADFPPNDDPRYFPQSHEIEKDEALWDEINVQVADTMATAATLSSGSESEPHVADDAGIEVEPRQIDVTLESDIFAPLQCTVNRQLFVDNPWPMSSAEAEKGEGAPQTTREEVVEEPIVEARIVSQTCGVPVFSRELELGQGPSEPEVELRIGGELSEPSGGDRSIIETRIEAHHPVEVPPQVGPGPSLEDPPGSETRGRSKEPRYQGGTLPPSGSTKPEKVPRSRRSRSESFFGFLRRKSKSRELDDEKGEEEGRAKGSQPAEGGKEREGSADLRKTSSAKTTPTISRSKDNPTGSGVKKSKSQGQSFFEKLGFGRTSKKSEKGEKPNRGEGEKRREASQEGDKRKEGEEEEARANPQKQTSSAGTKTNIRIFEILAKNGEMEPVEVKDTESGQHEVMLKSDHPASVHHHHQGREVLTDTGPGLNSALVQKSAAEEDDALLAGRSVDYLFVGDTLKHPSSAAETGASIAAKDVRSKFIVAVAIDFGTAFSGYAFCFLRDPDSIHMMGRWENGDPGVINQKTPTTLLLTPQGQFHSFGFTARNSYHDLSAEESKQWLYFDRFKMALYENQDCSQGMTIEAANGERFSGVDAISMTLRFFRDHALEQISSQSETRILNDDVLWVVTVPAIWNASAKQLMRVAAYKAELVSPDRPDQLLVALEPEAASVHIRRLQLRHLVPEKPIIRPLSIRGDEQVDPSTLEFLAAQFNHVVRYMVVDCGGGTVDITVHELNSMNHRLQEIHVATGGPHGSFAIDRDFERLLGDIFGVDFIDSYRRERPSGWVGLMMAFETRKRAADPRKTTSLNVALPFSFIEHYRKTKGSTVDAAIRGYGDSGVRWSSQGMLRLTQDAMKRLFKRTLDAIKEAIENVLRAVKGIDYIFLVGGLSESGLFQCDVRETFKDRVRKVVIPQEANLAVIKGAVVFGLDPAVISVRRSRLTYGAAVLNRFIRDQHPDSKLVLKDGVEWCRDVFDIFVGAGQVVRAGETVVRQYIPAAPTQSRIVIGIFCTEQATPRFVSDPGVRKCANVSLDLDAGTGSAPLDSVPLHQTMTRRRIEARLVFAETEIKVTATDTTTGRQVAASIDFLNV